jgi:16S rRNA (guanine966-N2)-methyltransferase
MEYLRQSAECFDVIFLDPPFRQNVLASALEQLPGRVAAGGRVYLEAPAPLELQAPWRELKRARAGQVSYQLLEKQ